MKPEKREWSNVVMGEGQDHVLPCPAHRDEVTGEVTIVWSLTDAEIESIVKNRVIYSGHSTYGQPMQPVILWAVDDNNVAIKDDRY